jgi:hypothetical protein
MWLGIVTLLLAAAITVTLPLRMGPLPAGMRTPIIAFELARTPAEVEAMFGAPDSAARRAWAAAMDRANRIDFAFMVAYAAYIVAFSRALAALGSTAARASQPLAVLAVVFDALENMQLFTITARLGGDYIAALAALVWFTWLKWIALAVALACWAPCFARLGGLGRVAAASALLTLTVTAVALSLRGIFAELMALGVTITLVTTFIIAVQNRARDATTPGSPAGAT